MGSQAQHLFSCHQEEGEKIRAPGSPRKNRDQLEVCASHRCGLWAKILEHTWKSGVDPHSSLTDSSVTLDSSQNSHLTEVHFWLEKMGGRGLWDKFRNSSSKVLAEAASWNLSNSLHRHLPSSLRSPLCHTSGMPSSTRFIPPSTPSLCSLE